jgi:predicted O-methyltransferase YrrM
MMSLIKRGLSPRYRAELMRKVARRITGRDGAREAAEAAAWCAARAQDVGAWARAIDASLWKEAETFATLQQEHAQRTLANHNVRFGGGAHDALLYFVTRVRRPSVALETGVASGRSTRSILSAMEKNGSGALLSSDLPYLTQSSSEESIGILVEPALRRRWTVLTEGDRRNLPRLVEKVQAIDFFHYDSDKSPEGRAFAVDCVAPKLSPNAVTIFDDIHDNMHFASLTERHAGASFVFAHERKWVGVLWPAEAGR